MSYCNECVVCCKSSQTDIDGKGTERRNLKNINKHLTQYQITAIFTFTKLFDISKSVCVNLLQNNNGTNPSSWFSLCWKCFTLIQEAEKIFNKLCDLEKQLSNLKECIQRKLVESYKIIVKNKTSKSTKNQNASRNIRDEAFTAISRKGSSPTESDDYELLEDIKIETDENSLHEQTSNDNENKSSFELSLSEPWNDDMKRTNKCIPKKKRNRRSIKPKNAFENVADFSDADDNLEPHQPNKANESSNLKNNRANRGITTRTNDIDTSSGIKGDQPKETLCNSESKEKYKDLGNDVPGEPKIFNCRYCNKQYRNIKYLRAHLRLVHTENFDADRSCGLYRRKAFHNDASEVCPICGKKFRTLKSLTIHKRNGHHKLEIQPFVCKHCNSGFPNDLRLKSHIYLHHDKKQLPFKCEECYHRSASFRRLQIHVARIHRKEKNYICEICSESFVDKPSLKVHQMRSHEEPENQEDSSAQCEECGRIMRSFTNLQKHIQVVHRKEFKFHCAICNIGRISQSAMDSHILREHTDAPQPYACTECEKTYVSKSKLMIHMRSHTGERPYKCPVCFKGFFEKSKMVRHQKSLHVKERLFECEKCHSKFPSQHYLASHIYSTHNKKVVSRPAKQVVDKQELLKCVQSTRKERCREFPKSYVTLHLEQQIQQGELVDTVIAEDPSLTPK